DGTFTDATEKLGLHTRVFNTQAVCLADINGDGVLDMVFNNEGQGSVVLLSAPEMAAKRSPVTLRLGGTVGVTGSRLRLLGEKNKLVASWHGTGGDGRGGQASLTPRFALEPGTYRVEHVLSNGQKRVRKLVVGERPVRLVLLDRLTRKE